MARTAHIRQKPGNEISEILLKIGDETPGKTGIFLVTVGPSVPFIYFFEAISLTALAQML